MAEHSASNILPRVNVSFPTPVGRKKRNYTGLTTAYLHEYRALGDAIRRCHNKNHPSFQWYGQRGITVCDLWRYGEGVRFGFQFFIEEVGPKPSVGLTLDRIDNERGYEPGNCRWAPFSVQALNKRMPTDRDVRFVTIEGTTKTAAQWCRENGINYLTAVGRFKRGWDPVLAVTAPPRRHRA